MDLGLSGRRVIVTGASRGIGEAIALGFAREGARLLLVARDQAKLDRAAEIARALGAEVVTTALDVTAPEAADAAAAAAIQAFGGIDVLVANAGGSSGGVLREATADDWQATYALNVGHAAAFLKASVGHMPLDGGAAVFISSISGNVPVPNRAHYAAAKAALSHAARSFALELAPLNIRVNAISPGSTYFEGGGWDRHRSADPQGFDAFVGEHPAKRLGRPEEIASAVLFLTSPAASWINGVDLAVDGGQLRPRL